MCVWPGRRFFFFFFFFCRDGVVTTSKKWYTNFAFTAGADAYTCWLPMTRRSCGASHNIVVNLLGLSSGTRHRYGEHTRSRRQQQRPSYCPLLELPDQELDSDPTTIQSVLAPTSRRRGGGHVLQTTHIMYCMGRRRRTAMIGGERLVGTRLPPPSVRESENDRVTEKDLSRPLCFANQGSRGTSSFASLMRTVQRIIVHGWPRPHDEYIGIIAGRPVDAFNRPPVRRDVVIQTLTHTLSSILGETENRRLGFAHRTIKVKHMNRDVSSVSWTMKIRLVDKTGTVCNF